MKDSVDFWNYSFNKYLLNICPVSNVILGSRSTAINKHPNSLSTRSFPSLGNSNVWGLKIQLVLVLGSDTYENDCHLVTCMRSSTAHNGHAIASFTQQLFAMETRSVENAIAPKYLFCRCFEANGL